MGVHALAVQDAASGQCVAVSAASGAHLGSSSMFASLSVGGLSSATRTALETIRLFQLHIDNVQGIASSVDEVCSSFGGPAYITYEVVTWNAMSTANQGSGFLSSKLSSLGLGSGSSADDTSGSHKRNLRVIVMWQNEPHEYHSQTLSRQALHRAIQGVEKVFFALVSRETEAIAYIQSLFGSIIRGEFNEIIEDKEEVKPKLLSFKGLFKKKSVQARSTAPSKRPSSRTLPAGVELVVQQERPDQAAPMDIDSKRSSSGSSLFRKMSTMNSTSSSEVVLEKKQSTLKKLTSTLMGKDKKASLGVGEMKNEEHVSSILSQVQEEVDSEKSILALPQSCFEMASIGKPLPDNPGDLRWFVKLLRNEWDADEHLTDPRHDGNHQYQQQKLSGARMYGTDYMNMHENADNFAQASRTAQYYAAMGNQFLGPQQRAYWMRQAMYFARAAAANRAAAQTRGGPQAHQANAQQPAMQQQRAAAMQTLVTQQQQHQAAGMQNPMLLQQQRAQQQQFMVMQQRQQQQQEIMLRQQQLNPMVMAQVGRTPQAGGIQGGPVVAQRLALPGVAPGMGAGSQQPPNQAQQQMSRSSSGSGAAVMTPEQQKEALKRMMEGWTPGTDPVRFKMNQFAESLEGGKLQEALKQVQESLQVIRQMGGGPVEREKETQTCVRYAFAIKIVIRIKALDAEASALNPVSPEYSKKMLESAALSSIAAELPLTRKHQIMIARIAIDRNIEASNYGIAAKFIRGLMEVIPQAQQGNLVQQLMTCQQNGERDTRTAPTSRVCYKSLMLVGSPYLKCNFCPALFHPQKGGVQPQQTCPFCSHGTIYPMK